MFLKKFLSIILLICICSTLCIPINVFATDLIAGGGIGNNLFWSLDDKGELTISGEGDMPYWTGGSDVPWFKYKDDIINVVIKRGVTNIGNYAFVEYPITNITISDSVTNIGKWSFAYCNDLKNIIIPSSVTSISNCAFWGIDTLTSITIPDKVNTIGANVFAGCNSLRDVFILNKDTILGIDIFKGCSSSLVLKGYSGSTTEKYANEYNITFERIDEKEDISENEICSICGDEIINDSVFYDDDGNIICESCSKNQSVELKCPHCSEILEISEDEYNERKNIICPDCMKFIIYEGEDTEYECFDCGEIFYYSETKVVENGKIYCPYCNEIVDEDDTEDGVECCICGEYFDYDSLTFDEDDNYICFDCYDEPQNEDEELIYIECPYCEEVFEDNEDIYDEDRYAICPYCDEYIDYIDEFSEEIKFTASEWALDEVNEAYQLELLPGEMENYDFTGRITRAEFAAIAVKLYEGLTGNTIYGFGISDTPFKDCDGVGLYADDITAAYLLGITTGTYEDLFEPYAYIDREQLATMLCRTIKKAKFDDWSLFEDWKYSFDIDYVKMFADDEEISDYAKNSVYFMASYGIINGINETHFAPKNTTIEQERMGYASATCEQAILMSLRSYNQLLDTDIELKQISYYDGFEYVISFGDFAGCEPYSYEFLYGANFCEIKYDVSNIPDFVINDYAIALMNEGYDIDGEDYNYESIKYWFSNKKNSTYNDVVLDFNWDKRLLTICITLENGKAVG